MQNQLCQQIMNASSEEQEIYKKLLFNLETKSYEAMEVPTAEAQKQLHGLQLLKVKLQGSFVDDYEEQFMKDYWKKNPGLKEIVENIPNMEEWNLQNRDFALLKKTGLIQCVFMDNLDTMYEELKQDTDSSSDSFAAVRQTMKTFMELNHAEVEDSAEYRTAYLKLKAALSEYMVTRSGTRHTEKGNRRRNLVNRILDWIERIEIDVNLLAISKATQVSLQTGTADGTLDARLEQTAAHMDAYFEQPMILRDIEKNVDAAIASQEPMELFGALFQIESVVQKFQLCDKFHEEKLESSHETIIEEWKEKLQSAMEQLSYEGKQELAQGISEYFIALHRELVAKFCAYREEAPDDTDPDNFAYLKMINTPITLKSTVLSSLLYKLNDVDSLIPIAAGIPSVIGEFEMQWKDLALYGEIFDKACQCSSDMYKEKVKPEIYEAVTKPYQDSLYEEIKNSQFV